MDSPLEDQHRSVSGGGRSVKRDNLTEQSSKDARTVSINPSPDGAVIGPSTDKQTESRDAGGHSEYASNEQNILYSGYGSSTGAWDGYSQYANADGLNVVSPVIFNDSPSVVFHSGYGFNPDGSYGQYSPVATPIPPLMLEGQLYSTQRLPFSPSYYPQQAMPGLPHLSSPFPVSATELMAPESSNTENMLYSPGPGYLVNFGSFGGGNVPGNLGCATLSTSAYPPPMGILGSYDQNISQQQRPVHGFGLVSSAFTGHYPQSSTNQTLNYGGNPISYLEQSRLNLDKGRRRERDRDSISLFSDSNYFSNDRNRGPRSLKVKEKGAAAEQGPSFDLGSNDASSTRIYFDLYNSPNLATDYENAKFFIIKSFSEDNVHKSIKYKVWASTPHGNKKLDAAYLEAKAIGGSCPIFLFFSVNASGQFCGVAEMVGPVDFEKSANYWQQDRWSGQFPVQWHIVKDVPNIRFRHIILENNDNKPVTHSRDSQEVKLKHGVEMLKIFKEHDTRTSILDDFDFYDEREKMLKERKAKQPYPSKESPNRATDTINSLSDSFSQAMHFNACTKEESITEERVTEQRATSRANAPYSFEDPINQTPDQISQVLWSDLSKKEGLDSSTGIGH